VDARECPALFYIIYSNYCSFMCVFSYVADETGDVGRSVVFTVGHVDIELSSLIFSEPSSVYIHRCSASEYIQTTIT